MSIACGCSMKGNSSLRRLLAMNGARKIKAPVPPSNTTQFFTSWD